MPNLNELTEAIHGRCLEANEQKAIKLLNVCHDDKIHNYWRFKTPDGKIFQISIWEEDPPGCQMVPTPFGGF